MLRYFHKLKVSQKLALISVLFMIPDSVLLCLFLISINDNIHFARWEIRGNQYQRPLEQLLRGLPEHYLALGDADATELHKIQSRVDLAFANLAFVDAELGADLQFTDEGLAKRNRTHLRVRNLRAEWKALKKASSAPDKRQLLPDYLHLISDVRGMITHAGDNSNLILDPDLDSYYLMDVTLLALPEMQDRLWNVTRFGAEVLDGKKTLSNKDRSQLAVYTALLKQSDLDRIIDSAHTALNEDLNFYGRCESLQRRLPPALREFKEAAEKFIELTERLSADEPINFTAAEYIASGTKARVSSFSLWTIADEEVDHLLEKRISHYKSRRTRSLSLTGMALMAAIGFVTFITRSISRPLQRHAAELAATNTALKNEIEERHRIEKALRAAEEKYRGIFENSVEGIFRTTRDGAYLVANPTLARMYGYNSVEELQGELSDIGARLYVEAKRRDDFQSEIKRLGAIHGFESEIYRRDGSKLWISENARAVYDESGEFLYYEGTVQDISERKRSQAALEKANKDLLDASRLAGMAEVATGILHNVGNVLNSVNVSANFIADNLRKSKIQNLTKVADMLTEHAGDIGQYLTADPKGKQLPSYIKGLAAHLVNEQDTISAKMNQLKKHVEHMKEIVAMQQSYAKVGGLRETIRVEEIIDDAIRLNSAGLNRHEIEVQRQLSPLPPVTLDKHKTLQILVNLIRNAEYACATSDRPDKKIAVCAVNGNGSVKISVQDNGVGIPPENMRKIFSHGFTTRKDGHGFGLHSGALAAKEIGGSLRAHSDGEGLGAVFTLELPLTETQSAYARNN